MSKKFVEYVAELLDVEVPSWVNKARCVDEEIQSAAAYTIFDYERNGDSDELVDFILDSDFLGCYGIKCNNCEWELICSGDNDVVWALPDNEKLDFISMIETLEV